jgi:hypothetical protein
MKTEDKPSEHNYYLKAFVEKKNRFKHIQFHPLNTQQQKIQKFDKKFNSVDLKEEKGIIIQNWRSIILLISDVIIILFKNFVQHPVHNNIFTSHANEPLAIFIKVRKVTAT